MPILDVAVPQLGEGLQEVLVRRFLKKPGEFVERDEPIYVMETDKASVEVESPYAGILKDWLSEEGKVLPVGALIARIEGAVTPAVNPLPSRSASSPPETGQAHIVVTPSVVHRDTTSKTAAASVPFRTSVFVPPRTRAYCRKLGIPDNEVDQIPAASTTLMPHDVDRYLATKAESSPKNEKPVKAATPVDFDDYPLPVRQRVFSFRLRRSAQLVVPGTMVRELDWQTLEAAVETLNDQYPDLHPSDFEAFAYALVHAARDHPEFRSVLVGDDIVRRFEHLNLGIAVQRPNGDLLTAVVPNADRLDFTSFVTTLQHRVKQALEGEDQVNEQVPLHLNYVSRLEITGGTSVLVAPAVAVVFLGAPTGRDQERKSNLGVTFDHRLINGVSAANLLAAIVRQINRLASKTAGARDEKAIWDRATVKTLRELDPKDRRPFLEKLLTEHVAGMIGASPTDIDTREPLRRLGFSSRMALELTTCLATNLRRNLSATLLWTYPTIAELAAHLADDNDGGIAAVEEPERRIHESGLEASAVLDRLENLSEDEADALLRKKLERS